MDPTRKRRLSHAQPLRSAPVVLLLANRHAKYLRCRSSIPILYRDRFDNKVWTYW